MNKKKIWIVIKVLVIVLVIIWIINSVITIFGHSFPKPTKAEVERYLKENSCNPSAIETDSETEYECGRYLRRHSTLKFGQIYNNPPGTFLFIYTPFSYFNFIEEDQIRWNSEEKFYILVVTRDEGPLVYNPVNGKFIGHYNDLMLKMGCKNQVDEDLDLANAQCLLEKHQQFLDNMCSFNQYDCKDFETQNQAQNIFNYCKKEGKGDVYYLDGDNDGIACESL